MNQQGEDLMMQAPSTVEEARLKELHIRIAMPPVPQGKDAPQRKVG